VVSERSVTTGKYRHLSSHPIRGARNLRITSSGGCALRAYPRLLSKHPFRGAKTSRLNHDVHRLSGKERKDVFNGEGEAGFGCLERYAGRVGREHHVG
jgi:hypothetical protein